MNVDDDEVESASHDDRISFAAEHLEPGRRADAGVALGDALDNLRADGRAVRETVKLG